MSMFVETMKTVVPPFFVRQRPSFNDIKARVFVADPNQSARRAIQVYFESYGADVRAVKRATNILSTARLWQPNIILLSDEFYDDQPDQLCQTLLTDKRTAHIPVIMLMEAEHKQTRLKYLELGADNVVPKPFDLEELRLRVEAVIRLSTH